MNSYFSAWTTKRSQQQSQIWKHNPSRIRIFHSNGSYWRNVRLRTKTKTSFRIMWGMNIASCMFDLMQRRFSCAEMQLVLCSWTSIKMLSWLLHIRWLTWALLRPQSTVRWVTCLKAGACVYISFDSRCIARRHFYGIQ